MHKNPFRKQYDHWFERYRKGDKDLDDNLLGMIGNGLSEEEASFILSFTARKSSWVNMELRNGIDFSTIEKAEFAEGLTNAISKMPSFDNEIVYRMDSPSENEDGIVREWFSRKIGSIFRIPYFLSTSKANWKNTAYTWKINTLKRNSLGNDISNMTNNKMENEILFHRNSIFRVDNVDNDFIHLTEIEENQRIDFDLVGLYYKNIK